MHRFRSATTREVFSMLAYLFWHRPSAQVEQQLYEASITRFQADLAAHPPPGFISAASFKIDPMPWLGEQAGHEDWYLLEGSWAMDPLNAYAITGHRQASHDGVAAQMADGCGGLYAHAGGEFAAVPQSTLFWLTRPRGIRWQRPFAPIARKRIAGGGRWFWGRPPSSLSPFPAMPKSRCPRAGRRAACRASACRANRVKLRWRRQWQRLRLSDSA
jgi:hypothetical protein